MPVLAFTASLAVKGIVTASSGLVRPVVNVFSYQLTAGVLGATWQDDLAQSWVLGIWGFVAAHLSTDYLGDSVRVYADPLLVPPGHLAAQTPPNGGKPLPREPISVCANLWCQTGFRGKSFRSVKRLGPVATSDVVNDGLTPVAQTAWQTDANKLLLSFTDIGGNTWAPVLLSRQLSVEGPPASFVGAPLLAIRVNRTLGLARHRRERTQL